MKTYALVGESGTGKSYNSIGLAEKYNLSHIIDDGLLISGNKIVAGTSAKKEPSIVAAVKRAIFYDEYSRNQVKEAIERVSPGGILVLGTSTKMVEKIRTALSLPEYSKIIRIEDICSEDEITKAKITRQSQGKHVIPVPVMEIRKTFSGYFLDPLRVFRKSANMDLCEDKSIVRPSYSYLGDFVINDTVLCTLASYEASRCEGVSRVSRISVTKTSANVVFNVEVVLEYGVDIKKCSEEIIFRIKDSVEKYASVYTDFVNLTVKSLNMK